VPDLAKKGRAFRALHERDGTFVIPNPADAGGARLLQGLGFEALATSSAGYAFSTGRRDYAASRDEMLRHVEQLAAATLLPISADLENGFGDSPETVAETIRLAAAAGAVGGSIEDSTGCTEAPLYWPEVAAERIRAAAEAARSLPFPFTLTARAENFLVGRPDLADTIARLQAFQEAGADVLYAPGITSSADIATLVSSVDSPVNVLAGLPTMKLGHADLAALGVKRISVGSALARAAYGGFLDAAREIREKGTFNLAEHAMSYGALSELFPAPVSSLTPNTFAKPS
jgi:2-methylisocitrate lyase-like PEP mutase family enzyme